MKKIRKLIICLLILLCFVTSVNAQAISKEEKFYEDNYKMITISDNIQKYINEQYNIKEVFVDKYPEYFGGIYISDDAKNIIVQIVENNIPEAETKDYEIYNKIIKFDDSVKVEYVNNSFNDLNKINNAVSSYLTSSKKNDNVVGSYIDVINNSSVVELISNIEKNRKDFDEELNYIYDDELNLKAIKYVRAENQMLSATTLKSGAKFRGYYESRVQKYAMCSTGFRTKYNNRNGFVTAGHCLSNVGTCIQSGDVLYRQFANNQYYDFGFVATNSSYNISNDLAYPSGNVTKLAVVSYCPTITVNMAISKSGYKTGYTSGKVTVLNYTTTLYDEFGDSYIIKGLVKSNLKAGPGDSGGVVFIPRTDSQGGAIPIGVCSAASTGFLGIGQSMSFTSLNNMPSSMQTGRY